MPPAGGWATRENLVEARRFVKDGERIAVVTEPLHMQRAITIARDVGLDAVPAPTPYTCYRTLGAKLPFAARET